MNKRWHTLAAHRLSSLLPEISIPGDSGIFQLTLNSEQSTNVSRIHFGKVEMAQQSCHHCVSPTMTVAYLLNMSPCYSLQVRLMCHDDFYGSIMEFFAHAQCVPGAPSDFASAWERGYTR